MLLPAEWPARRAYHWQTLLRARANENQMFVAGCNRVGESKGEVFGGGSALIDPWGEAVIEGGSRAALLTAEIDLGRWTRCASASRYSRIAGPRNTSCKAAGRRAPARTPQPPLLSVVVSTYNRCESVERLLSSLDRQTLPAAQFEVVVVIDGSEDGTREMVAGRAAAYAAAAIWQPNQKRAAACNAGVRAAAGELVLILDDDMEAAPGAGARIWRRTPSCNPRGPALGVVGPVPMQLPPDAPPGGSIT